MSKNYKKQKIIDALKSLPITWWHGDEGKQEVIIPALCGKYVLDAVKKVGAIPVFADIDERALCITEEAVRPLVNEKTKAIIIVGLYGMPAFVKPLKQFNVPIIEDCMENQGCMELPERGDVVCYNSEKETFKNLTKRRRILGWYGMGEKAINMISPMSMITRFGNNKKLVKLLKAKGVDAKVGYHPLYPKGKGKEFPVSERMGREVVLLPTDPEMKKSEIVNICKVILTLSLESVKSAQRLASSLNATPTTQQKKSKRVKKNTT